MGRMQVGGGCSSAGFDSSFGCAGALPQIAAR